MTGINPANVDQFIFPGGVSSQTRTAAAGRAAATLRQLRRDAVRGDDLVGGAAGDFGHAVERPREPAGAGGCRP